MHTDTGNDFIMINALYLNDNPPALAATGPGADAMDISGIEGAKHREQGALFRYCSRRDILAIATDPALDERHDYKMAALTKTIAYPVEPIPNPDDFRILFTLILFAVLRFSTCSSIDTAHRL